MKRICAFLLTLACCLSLFGCKKQTAPAPSQTPTEATTETPTEVTTEVSTEMPTEEPTKKPIKATVKATTAATKATNKRPAATKASVAATKASVAATSTPTKAPTEATAKAPATEATQAHTHTFGEWVLQAASTCTIEGREDRRCSECGFTESRALDTLAHRMDAYNVCKDCLYTEIDPNADFVELGVVCSNWYGTGATANISWDIKYWNGKIYRGAGDYDKNSGATRILAFDIATQTWEIAGIAADEAIQSFEEIGGTLYAPGIDPREGWDLGNFYVLQEDGKWKQVRNLPNGVHNFDMIEHDGRIFAGLGTETIGKTVAVSEDGGKTFQFVPLYKDGKLMNLSGYKMSRTYEFIKYKGEVYALVCFQMGIGGEWAVFRYEDGKMHYMANGYKLFGTSTSRKYFVGEFEHGGACYIATGGLTVVTDFSDPENWKKIPMPGGETVMDALLRDGVIYTLTYSPNKNPHTHNTESYKTVIYKSATGQEGSFEEVLSFDYCATPMSFDYDGEHFYIGTGTSLDSAKVGMVLRAKPAG